MDHRVMIVGALQLFFKSKRCLTKSCTTESGYPSYLVMTFSFLSQLGEPCQIRVNRHCLSCRYEYNLDLLVEFNEAERTATVKQVGTDHEVIPIAA